MGEEWRKYRLEIFGDPYLVWHDGPSFDALIAAYRVAPDTVIDKLKDGLTNNDPLAAQSIRALAAEGYPRADLVPVLTSRLVDAHANLIVRIAEALYTLTGDPQWAEQIVPILDQPGHWTERIDAAISLAGFPPTPLLAEALARGMQHDEYLVRYHSAEGLLAYLSHRGVHRDRTAVIAVMRDTDPRHWTVTAEDLLRRFLETNR